MDIKKVLESGRVSRYHATLIDKKQTVDIHSWEVAVVLRHIYPNCSRDLLFYALTHDSAEIYTSDIAAPVKKRNPELKEVFDRMEDEYILETLKIVHPEFSTEETSSLEEAIKEDFGEKGLERFKEFSRIVFNKGYKMLQVFSEEDFPELSETKNADYFRTGGRVRADEVRRLKGVAKVCAQNEIPLNFVNPNQGSIKVYNFGEIFSYATHRSVRGQLIEIPEGRRKTYLKDKMEPHLIEDLRGMLDLESEITDRRLVIGKFKLWQPRAPRLVENISGNQLSIF